MAKKFKQYKEYKVDEKLSTDILDRLNNIKGIKIKGICNGHRAHKSKRYPWLFFPNKAYVAFRVNKNIIPWGELKKLPNITLDEVRHREEDEETLVCIAAALSTRKETLKKIEIWWEIVVNKIESINWTNNANN